jgi:pimeloyl-ACP methyl ester carboxylesterase
MKKNILFFALIIIILFSESSTVRAVVVAPPPTCDIFATSQSQGTAFTFRGQPRYENGLLVLPLTIDPTGQADPEFNLRTIFLNFSDCDFLFPFVNSSSIPFPGGLTHISLRFTSDNHFVVYNDDLNVPLGCAECEVTFSGSQTPPYKVTFFVSDNSSSHNLSTKALEIRQPNLSPQRIPILIVPGIMGTEIDKTGTILWADVGRMLNPFHSDDFMDPLSFKSNGSPLDTSLTLGPVLRKPSIKLNYTQRLIDDLVNSGYTEGEDLFTFPYDWRKDITDIANQNLTGQIDYILNQTAAGQAVGKVDIIAHSQGGLVVKKLLYDKPEYKNVIDKLVFVGVPNLGAPKAAKVLLYGDNMGVSFGGLGLDADEVKKISLNMPAVYELLPGQEYFNHVNGYLGTVQFMNSSVPHVTTLNDPNTISYLKSQSLNNHLIDVASDFHTDSYDNLDLNNTGIQAYNIVGCQTGTLGKIAIKGSDSFQLLQVPGDGTVPVFSANNIPGTTTYFALDSNHSTMLTDEGTRQQIINSITGSNFSTNGKITSNISDCHFNGSQVAAHSPVELHIYDQLGRHVGPTPDGGFDSEIPNVGYEIISHDKFAFLPEGGQYTVKLLATDSGSFNFDSSAIQEGQITSTLYYDHIPISGSSIATIPLSNATNQPIELDTNGDGSADVNILPSSVLNANQSLDLAPPITTAIITGTQGQQRFYRSNVNIALSASDVVVSGQESETSGLLKTQYKLDNAGYQTYNPVTPLLIADEGVHTLSFFSTDRAGNNEREQTLNLTIDKTAPEFSIQFNPNVKDLQFTGTDNLSPASSVNINDGDDKITLTDQAGNTTQIKLKDKERKRKLKAEVLSLLYNGQPAAINKTALKFDWEFDKNNNLKELEQQVKSRKDFNIEADYNGKKTVITRKDGSGRINKTFNGLVLLKIKTSRGDLSWGY